MTKAETRFYTGYPKGWQWVWAIDEENVILQRRYCKMIFNIPAGRQTPIPQSEYRRIMAEMHKAELAERPERKAELIAIKEEKIAELEKKIEKIRKELEELREG